VPGSGLGSTDRRFSSSLGSVGDCPGDGAARRSSSEDCAGDGLGRRSSSFALSLESKSSALFAGEGATEGAGELLAPACVPAVGEGLSAKPFKQSICQKQITSAKRHHRFAEPAFPRRYDDIGSRPAEMSGVSIFVRLPKPGIITDDGRFLKRFGLADQANLRNF
jgi:hypothetical protein